MSINLKRERSVDLYKGILITSVVVGHYIQFIYDKENFDKNIIFRFIYSFHMPFFIFLSGYVLSKSNISKKFYLKYKFYNYVIPFLTIFSLGLIIRNENLIMGLKKIINKPDYGLWYLWILFLCCTYLKVSQLALKKIKIVEVKIILSVFLIMILGKSIQRFGFPLLGYHYVFFIVGYYFDKINIFKIKYTSLLILLYIALFPYYSRVDEIKYFSNFPLGNIVFKYILAFSFIIPVFIFRKKIILESKLEKIFLFISENTLAIYIFHFYFLNSKMGSASIIFSIAISILIGNFIKRNKILKFLFLGDLKNSDKFNNLETKGNNNVKNLI